MPLLGKIVDISELVDATVAGDSDQLITVARALLEQKGVPASILIGRVGMIAAHGDKDGHAILTLNAASTLAHWCNALPHASDIEPQARTHEQELPFLVQVLVATAPEVRAGQAAKVTYPEPFFPSEYPEGKSRADMMHDAIYGNDATLIERLLFGLYGSGADYRTMQLAAYEGIATTFQNAGHPLIFAVRGTQLLDWVDWGDRVPTILHWLTPHLPLHTEEPEWIKTVRSFVADEAHSVVSLRTRLSAPKEENALPLRRLLVSDADTTQVCQAVYDGLMKGGASARGIGSVVALTAADIMQRVGDGDRDAFVRAAHGLLFAAAVRLAFREIEDVALLPLLFTSAAFVNTLSKEVGQQTAPSQPATKPSTVPGGGLIATALLETLSNQLGAQDFSGALSTTRRYLQLGNDPRALFAAIGLVAAQADAAADQGHTLQIVQAAGEEFLAWPADLTGTNIEGLVQVALRAAAFARRNNLVSNL